MAKGFTNEYMAHQLDITAPAYSKIEKGYTKLSVETLDKISSILQVPLVDLLKAIDDKNFVFINCNNSIGLNSNSPISFDKQPTEIEAVKQDITTVKALLDFMLKEIQYLRTVKAES